MLDKMKIRKFIIFVYLGGMNFLLLLEMLDILLASPKFYISLIYYGELFTTLSMLISLYSIIPCNVDSVSDGMLLRDIKKEDVELLDVTLKNISKIYVQDLKQKQLGAFERRDLFKIREEIQDVHIALDKKINHKHIDLNLK